MKIKIPLQLQQEDFGFVLIKAKTKIPLELKWQENPYKYYAKKLQEHIDAGGNYGIVGGYGDLRIIDADNKEFADEIETKVGETFTVQTGSGNRHFYLFSEYSQNHVFNGGKGEFRAKNSQVLAPPSIHPNGQCYTVLKDSSIKRLTKEQVLEIITPYLKPKQIKEGEEEEELSEEELKKKLKCALEKDKKLRDLCSGAWKSYEYPSRSEAELALVDKLMWWEFSESEISQIMRRSEIGKWNEKPKAYHESVYAKARENYKDKLKRVVGKQSLKTENDDRIPEQYLKILKDENLFKKIVIDEFDKKIIGEQKTRAAIFLSLCNIWLDETDIPINTIVSSESSAGKSFICKQIYNFFPEHLREYQTKISKEAFTYWKDSKNNPAWTWDGKICYLEDAKHDILNSDTFKVMCSEGSKAVIVIRNKAVEINIVGKPCMLITTAAGNPKAEVLNRFNLISLDESPEQTKKIIKNQANRAVTGETKNYDSEMKQSLLYLKRVGVKIPFAEKIYEYLCENYSFDSLRFRRDFNRLLKLIKNSTALHQYQREQDADGFFLSTYMDYRLALSAIEIIKTNTFLSLTHRLKKAYDCCKTFELGFTAKEIHSNFPFASTQMWYKYLDQLCERGLLKTQLEERDGVKQRVTIYYPEMRKDFTLPAPDTLKNS